MKVGGKVIQDWRELEGTGGGGGRRRRNERKGKEGEREVGISRV